MALLLLLLFFIVTKMNAPANTILVKDPLNRDVEIPVNVLPGSDSYSALTSPEAIKHYFDQHGYVVLRNVISGKLCDEVLQYFRQEVKPYKGYIYRQASANPEKHVFNPNGHMLNAVLNVQSLQTRLFPGFKKKSLEVLTNEYLITVIRKVMGDDPALVQSMYFEGNPATWAHQDSYYLDSEKFNMVAAWVALEDIAPEAGRFYVCPGTHKIDMEKNGGNFDIAFNHDRYKELIRNMMAQNRIRISAPALNKGDIMLWHAKTIHGSLETTNPLFSRHSFTAHYIPRSERFLQFQRIIKPMSLKTINGIGVNHPKDLDNITSRMILFAETSFPKTFQLIKKIAIKALLK